MHEERFIELLLHLPLKSGEILLSSDTDTKRLPLRSRKDSAKARPRGARPSAKAKLSEK